MWQTHGGVNVRRLSSRPKPRLRALSNGISSARYFADILLVIFEYATNGRSPDQVVES
jgi:hypothetical protein